MPSWRELLLRLAGSTPVALREWTYRHPAAYRSLARVIKWLVPRDRPLIVTVSSGPAAGMRLVVDRDTPNYYFLAAGYEEPLARYVRAAIPRGGVTIDVGAHVGIFTLLMSRCVGPGGSVLSFEPDPSNFERLRRNCAVNNLANVRLFRRAMTDRHGPAVFTASGTTTSRLGSEGDSSVVTVEATRLDDLVDAELADHLELVKIDVEGSEAAVLRGGTRLLARYRPLLVIELHTAAAARECTAVLKGVGYAVAALPGEDVPKPFRIHRVVCRPLG